MAAKVQGWTAEGFEGVAETLSARADEVGRGGSAFCATVAGEVVADVWIGEASPGRPWEHDTVSSLFSATKGMVAGCIALLVERGQLDVDLPVATWWPEFAAGGKQDLTVRQVLSHTSGLTEIPGYADFMRIDGRGWGDLVEIRRRLAASVPQWEPGTAQGYHVQTYGYLAGTIVELVSGKPVARFFDDEFARPLGLDVRIGLPSDVVPRATTLVDPDPLPPQLAPIVDTILGPTRDPATIAGRACIAQDGEGCLDHLAVMGGNPEALNAGGAFGDGIGTARALAGFYASLLDGTKVSAETLESVTRVQRRGPDLVLMAESAYAVGFARNVELPTGGWSMGPSFTAFGHGGAGGQAGLGDPERGVSIGFVRSHLSHVSTLARTMVEATYTALDAL